MTLNYSGAGVNVDFLLKFVKLMGSEIDIVQLYEGLKAV